MHFWNWVNSLTEVVVGVFSYSNSIKYIIIYDGWKTFLNICFFFSAYATATSLKILLHTHTLTHTHTLICCIRLVSFRPCFASYFFLLAVNNVQSFAQKNNQQPTHQMKMFYTRNFNYLSLSISLIVPHTQSLEWVENRFVPLFCKCHCKCRKFILWENFMKKQTGTQKKKKLRKTKSCSECVLKWEKSNISLLRKWKKFVP